MNQLAIGILLDIKLHILCFLSC